VIHTLFSFYDPATLFCDLRDSVFFIASNSDLLLVNKTIIILKTERTIIMTIGIGSSNSLANGAPIVKDFETSTMMLMAVPFLAKGNIRSS